MEKKNKDEITFEKRRSSPNRKYRKNRTYNYDSKRPVPIVKNNINYKNTDSEEIRKHINSNLISQELFSILQESPEQVSQKKWRKRAKICGIDLFRTDGNAKTSYELKKNFELMIEYINKLEDFEKADSDYKIFKVNTIKEIADVLKIPIDGQTNSELLIKIKQSLEEIQ